MEQTIFQANCVFLWFWKPQESSSFPIHFWSSIRRWSWLRYWLMRWALQKEHNHPSMVLSVLANRLFTILAWGKFIFNWRWVFATRLRKFVAAVEAYRIHYAFSPVSPILGMGWMLSRKMNLKQHYARNICRKAGGGFFFFAPRGGGGEKGC